MKARRGVGGLSPIGGLLRGLGTVRVPPTVDASPVAIRDWEAAVGSRIAARARPWKLERGVLHVRAATATWAQELSLLSEAIAEQLRSRGVAVKSLRFIVGAVEALARPPERDTPRTSPPDAPIPPEVAAIVATIDDAELREAITRAAAKNLGWQQMGATSGRSGARAPRRAGAETAPKGRTPPPDPAAPRRKP